MQRVIYTALASLHFLEIITLLGVTGLLPGAQKPRQRAENSWKKFIEWIPFFYEFYHRPYIKMINMTAPQVKPNHLNRPLVAGCGTGHTFCAYQWKGHGPN